MGRLWACLIVSVLCVVYGYGGAKLEAECKTLQQKFASSSTQFTNCLGKNTKPVHICVNCVDTFKNVKSSFVNITKSANCSETLLDSDNAMVTRRLWDAYYNMWSSALCDSCSGLTVDIAENFINKTDEVVHCFETTAHRTICQKCNNEYDTLLNLFKTLQRDGFACADLADSMNSTSHSWSVSYNCGHLPLEYLPVLTMTLGVSLVPVIFYLSLWKFG